VAIEIVGSATFAQTLKAMAPGGRVVVVGNLESGTIELNPGLLIVKELEILGAYATTAGELETALRLTHAGKLAAYVTDVLPPGGRWPPARSRATGSACSWSAPRPASITASRSRRSSTACWSCPRRCGSTTPSTRATAAPRA